LSKKKEMRDMKKLGILGLAAVLVTAFATGCNKQESTPAPSGGEQPAVVKETGTTTTATTTTGTMGTGTATTGTESTMTTTTATTTTTTETKK